VLSAFFIKSGTVTFPLVFKESIEESSICLWTDDLYPRDKLETALFISWLHKKSKQYVPSQLLVLALTVKLFRH